MLKETYKEVEFLKGMAKNWANTANSVECVGIPKYLYLPLKKIYFPHADDDHIRVTDDIFMYDRLYILNHSFFNSSEYFFFSLYTNNVTSLSEGTYDKLIKQENGNRGFFVEVKKYIERTGTDFLYLVRKSLT